MVEGGADDRLWFYRGYIEDKITIMHIEYGVVDAMICLDIHKYL